MAVPAAADRYASRRSTGEYDSTLVCEACERKFSEPDRYAKKILLDTDWERVMATSPYKPNGVMIEFYDYAKLKLFCMSLAWRMSATARPFFESVQLGIHEERLRKLLLMGEPGSVDDFSVIVARFDGPVAAQPVLHPRHAWGDPRRLRWDGINILLMYAADVMIYMKTDQRVFPEWLRRLSLRPDSPLLVNVRNFETSSELRGFRELARLEAARRSSD